MHAKILILDHDSSRVRQLRRHIQGLLVIFGGRGQACSKIVFFTILGNRQAVDRTNIETGIALNTKIGCKHGLNVTIQTALDLLSGLFCCKPEFDLDIDFLESFL